MIELRRRDGAQTRLARWIGSWLVFLFFTPVTFACEVYSTLTGDQLSAYEFESDARSWRNLENKLVYPVGTIRIVRQEIFLQEANLLSTYSNKWHKLTSESVIRDVLLFRAGDSVNARVLAETERVLRAKSYLYDARVIPRRVCDGVVDIDVVVRDVWTLNPRLIINRSGSENQFGIGLGDTNVFGSGKSLAFGFESNQDREGTLLIYKDPNVAGTRLDFTTTLKDNDDGHFYSASLTRPFFALDTHWSIGVSASVFAREQRLYSFGEEIAEFAAETKTGNLFGGYSHGVVNGFTTRWLTGFSFEQHEFTRLDAVIAPQPFPVDRTLAYPWIGVQRIQSDFDKTLNHDRIQRTEDLRLGRRMFATLGYSADAFGGDGKKLIISGRWNDVERLGEQHLYSISADVHGYYNLDTNRAENLIVNGELKYRFRQADRLSFFAQLRGGYSRRLTRDKQILLGGKTGLRGYPNRFQEGDRWAVLTIEQRYYSNLYPFKMFRLGAALFADVGRAWFPSGRDDGEFGVLSNVGLGLRMESTRTRRDRIAHLDFAFPLQDGPGVRGLEITVTAKQSF